MTKLDPISEGFEKAQILLSKAEANIDKLPKEVATFLMVYSAQGVIDNGGYVYFFEADWPNNPPYSKFVDAYKSIGCESQSTEFNRVISTFPFAEPHLKKDQRNQYMEDNFDEDKYSIKGWDDKLCGDEEVWEKLGKYYKKNINKFV